MSTSAGANRDSVSHPANDGDAVLNTAGSEIHAADEQLDVELQNQLEEEESAQVETKDEGGDTDAAPLHEHSEAEVQALDEQQQQPKGEPTYSINPLPPEGEYLDMDQQKQPDQNKTHLPPEGAYPDEELQKWPDEDKTHLPPEGAYPDEEPQEQPDQNKTRLPPEGAYPDEELQKQPDENKTHLPPEGAYPDEELQKQPDEDKTHFFRPEGEYLDVELQKQPDEDEDSEKYTQEELERLRGPLTESFSEKPEDQENPRMTGPPANLKVSFDVAPPKEHILPPEEEGNVARKKPGKLRFSERLKEVSSLRPLVIYFAGEDDQPGTTDSTGKSRWTSSLGSLGSLAWVVTKERSSQLWLSGRSDATPLQYYRNKEGEEFSNQDYRRSLMASEVLALLCCLLIFAAVAVPMLVCGGMGLCRAKKSGNGNDHASNVLHTEFPTMAPTSIIPPDTTMPPIAILLNMTRDTISNTEDTHGFVTINLGTTGATLDVPGYTVPKLEDPLSPQSKAYMWSG
ncbi:expressed unknown protein [Seminavis robusta]|uniref:Uncharacterized protein n=1 Tax=Seminavis robusta TaxID=568900 RepID=A0A9N8DCK7_9STRA|nr:expressed unknown protein [Seminavis robusta]|eukprot:Sro34_g021890.1 n/a (513) ;mRNA; f:31718-33462